MLAGLPKGWGGPRGATVRYHCTSKHAKKNTRSHTRTHMDSGGVVVSSGHGDGCALLVLGAQRAQRDTSRGRRRWSGVDGALRLSGGHSACQPQFDGMHIKSALQVHFNPLLRRYHQVNKFYCERCCQLYKARARLRNLPNAHLIGETAGKLLHERTLWGQLCRNWG